MMEAGPAASPSSSSRSTGEQAPGQDADAGLLGDNDVPLVVRVARGDKAALAAIFERHAPAVLRLASRICGAHSAGEVVHEVFQQLWRCPERFDPDRGSLRTFLLIRTHGCAVDLLRSNEGRRSTAAADPVRSTPTGVVLDDGAVAAMLEDRLANLVMELPGPERDAILLACLHDHTYREVAGLLGHPEEIIKVRIRSGLSRLGTELQLSPSGCVTPASSVARDARPR